MGMRWLRTTRTLALAALAASCARGVPPPAAAPAPAAAAEPSPSAAPSPAADPAFASAVRPVLAERCAPCHNPGGSMYAKLPFDDPATIRSHREGVLRRLKGDDLAAVTRWLDAP